MKLATLGAGSWGTALAAHLSNNHVNVTLWGRDQAQMDDMRLTAINSRYLPNLPLPKNLHYSADLEASVAQAVGIVIATPCHSFEQILQSIRPMVNANTSLIWACKGIADKQLLHHFVEQYFGKEQPAAIISGPSFASELARGMPTAATVAAHDIDIANAICGWFHSDTFRAYASNDIVGVQLAGALKNVYAIATGISDGLGYGANARAALITRGLAELMRLGTTLGARRDTLMGLSGVGDLVLTCTDNQSRNRRFGLALGQGQSKDEAVQAIGQVVEGINTCQEAADLATTHQIEMPITEEVFNIVHYGKDPRQAVSDLLARSQKTELA